jgi:hypothetical protein
VKRSLSTSMVLATRDQTARTTKRESARHTRFSDHRLAVKNSVKGETIFILIAIALEKGTYSGFSFEPGCGREHS